MIKESILRLKGIWGASEETAALWERVNDLDGRVRELEVKAWMEIKAWMVSSPGFMDDVDIWSGNDGGCK